jgi:hypothetical protein
MHHAHHSFAGSVLQRDVTFRVTEVLQVVASLLFRAQSAVLADLDALALLKPSFVIITSDVERRDALALWEFVDEIIELVVHSRRCDEFRLIESRFAVDPVPAIVDGRDPFAFEVVIRGIQDIEAGVFIAEMVICGDTEAMRPVVLCTFNFMLSWFQ